MKFILRCILLVAALTVALTASAREWRIGDVPRMQVQDSTRLVSNPDGILQPATEARINTLLRDIRSKSTAEVVVMVLLMSLCLLSTSTAFRLITSVFFGKMLWLIWNPHISSLVFMLA